jgi:hypothetical protein
VLDWLAEYGIEPREFERPSDLGVPATLTVIRRNLKTDARSYCVLPIDPAPPGRARRDAIVDAMAGYFPEARPRGFHPAKDVATFMGRKHAYVAAYAEHDVGRERAVDAA